MKLVIDIPKQDYIYIAKKHCLPSCDDRTLRKYIYEMITNGKPLLKCNECKYYEGVHNVLGHAPCKYHKIGGVLWNWYCSQFEADKDGDTDGNS